MKVLITNLLEFIGQFFDFKDVLYDLSHLTDYYSIIETEQSTVNIDSLIETGGHLTVNIQLILLSELLMTFVFILLIVKNMNKFFVIFIFIILIIWTIYR